MSRLRICFYLGLLACASLWGGAWFAWETHLEWKENGNYAHNSLPMNRVARDNAMIAAFATSLLIVITVRNLTRRPRQAP